VLDLDILVKPRYEEEWKKKVETARDEAAAAAIELLKTKLAEAAEKERRRLESRSHIYVLHSQLFSILLLFLVFLM